MNMLGNTLEEIALEKAGIIKENIPVVIGERKEETEDVFRKTAQLKMAPVYFAEENFVVDDYRISNHSIAISVTDKKLNRTNQYELALGGIYQTKNILTVLQALELLKDWKISLMCLALKGYV